MRTGNFAKSNAQSRCQGDQNSLRSRGIHDEPVQASPWGDALQRKDSDAAIESFWRCQLVETWSFLWSVGVPDKFQADHGRSPGFQARPRDVPGIPGFLFTGQLHNAILSYDPII